jgi:hypothetical protein
MIDSRIHRWLRSKPLPRHRTKRPPAFRPLLERLEDRTVPTVDHFSVLAPTLVTAGDVLPFTVVAQDANNNTVTDYAGTVTFSTSDPQGTLLHSFEFTTADQGVHTFNAILRTAGTQSISVTDDATGASGYACILVTHAALDHFQVDVPSSSVAGSVFPFTVTAQDAYGNTVTDYAGTVQFSTTDPQATLLHSFEFTVADQGTHTFNAILRTAGPQAIDVLDPANGASGEGVVCVTHAALDHFQVDVPPSSVAGSVFPFTVTAQDAFGNTVDDYAATVTFSTSDPQATLLHSFEFTVADQGTHTFNAILRTAGPQAIDVLDPATGAAGEGVVCVSPAALDHFQVDARDHVDAGRPFHVTVTAQDAYGNTVTDYGGTVHFSSSDDQAVLPSDYLFSTADQGAHTFLLTLNTPGYQTIGVNDVENGAVTGSATVAVRI